MNKFAKLLILGLILASIGNLAKAQEKAMDLAWHTLQETYKKEGMKGIATDVIKASWDWTKSSTVVIVENAKKAVNYTIAELPSDIREIAELITPEEKEQLQTALESAKNQSIAVNIKVAQYFGLPQDVMAGILIASGLVGLRAAVPPLVRAIPMVPYAVQYGALAGGTYAVGKAILPYVPYMPFLASNVDVKQVFSSVKDAIVSANENIANKLSLSPYATGLLGVTLATAGAGWMYRTAATTLRWARNGVYLALAWPLFQYSYSFAQEAYSRLSAQRLSKAQAQALVDEANRLADRSSQVAKTLAADVAQEAAVLKTEL